MSKKPELVWRVKARPWTVLVLAQTPEKALVLVRKILRSRYEVPQPRIESLELIGELEQP